MDQKTNKTPSSRHYIAPSRMKVKKHIESTKVLRGITGKLPVDIRSAVAFFCIKPVKNES
jgi:hypothetical protein